MSTILITGATSGIGLELARIAAAETYHIVIVARDEKQLATTAAELRKMGATVTTFAKDLASPTAPQELWQELQKQNMTIDILVNNAGFAVSGTFAKSDLGETTGMLELNINALVKLTRFVLPDMLARKQGRILNLSSTAAFLPGPFMAGYYASKAFVLSFSEAIGNELKDTGVTVTALCPGPTATNFAARADMKNSHLFNDPNALTAAQVAAIGWNAFLKGKSVVIAGHRNALTVFALRFLPRSLAAQQARQLQEKK